MKTQALKSQPGVSSLQRPRYTPGLLLEDDDLTAAVVYTRETMRLLMSCLFGCGVVCGLDVAASLDCYGRRLKLSVGRGLALDASGNPIHVPDAVTLEYDFQCDAVPTDVWVAVCWTEKGCRPKDVSCSQDEDSHRENTRLRDGYELRLYSTFPDCICSCGKPVATAGKPRSGCCQDAGASGGNPQPAAPAPAPGPTPAPPPAPNVAVSATTPTPAASATATSKVASKGAPADQSSDAWGQLLSTVERACPCYSDHLQGVCACGCTGSCVLLGHITLSGDPGTDGSKIDSRPLDVDVANRREVRPMLTGIAKCLVGQNYGQPPPPDPGQGEISAKP